MAKKYIMTVDQVRLMTNEQREQYLQDFRDQHREGLDDSYGLGWITVPAGGHFRSTHTYRVDEELSPISLSTMLIKYRNILDSMNLMTDEIIHLCAELRRFCPGLTVDRSSKYAFKVFESADYSANFIAIVIHHILIGSYDEKEQAHLGD